MNLTHLHLVLNHFPIVGTLIACLLLFVGLLRKQTMLQQTGALLLVIMAIIAIPVFLTGEPAEESVEHLAGISRRVIHEHEEAAEFAIWLMGLTGILSFLAYIFQQRVGMKGYWLVWVFSLLTFVSMARVGLLGGEIRHPEASSAQVGNTGSATSTTESAEEIEKEED